MTRGIIFDFNRTLYDPEKGAVSGGAKTLLRRLKTKFSLTLVTTEGDDKGDMLDKSGLRALFEYIESVTEKTPGVLLRICKKMHLRPKEVIIVGDRIRGEITAGNKAGMTTVWLKKGKFAHETPETKLEKPNFVVEKLEELEDILKEKL